VLKAGGRFAVADIVTKGRMPTVLQRSLELWAGCIAGALAQDDYKAKLAAAGFGDIEIESVREYTAADAESGGLGDLMRRHAKRGAEGLGIISAIIRARKPGGQAQALESIPVQVTSATGASACCGPDCCE